MARQPALRRSDKRARTACRHRYSAAAQTAAKIAVSARKPGQTQTHPSFVGNAYPHPVCAARAKNGAAANASSPVKAPGGVARTFGGWAAFTQADGQKMRNPEGIGETVGVRPASHRTFHYKYNRTSCELQERDPVLPEPWWHITPPRGGSVRGHEVAQWQQLRDTRKNCRWTTKYFVPNTK